MFRLVDPYVSPILYIRQPGEDAETRVPFPDDDPFFSEISHFIDAIENPEADPTILSSYDGESHTSIPSRRPSLTGWRHRCRTHLRTHLGHSSIFRAISGSAPLSQEVIAIDETMNIGKGIS